MGVEGRREGSTAEWRCEQVRRGKSARKRLEEVILDSVFRVWRNSFLIRNRQKLGGLYKVQSSQAGLEIQLVIFGSNNSHV